jgi:hypothetical protein
VADVDHEQRVAVRLRARDLGRADRAAGTRGVLDDDLLLERVGHALRDEPGERVAGTAGGVRHDERHGLGGKVLRECRGGERERGAKRDA